MKSNELHQQWTASQMTIIFKPGYKCENPIMNSLSAYMFIRSVWDPELFPLQSHCMAFFLDRRGRTIAYRSIGTGNMTTVTVDIKLIACLAVQTLSNSVIIAVSRPSGNVKANNSDLELAQKLKEGLNLLNVQLLDYFVLCGNNYVSLADEDILSQEEEE